jgi:hypothetical protein
LSRKSDAIKEDTRKERSAARIDARRPGYADWQSDGQGLASGTAVPGLTLYQNTVPTAPNPCTYEPSLLVIPQGQKRVDLGRESYVFGETTFLLTSIELPIVSRVCAASVERPYLAFFLKLDMGMVATFFIPTRCRFPHRRLGHAAWSLVRRQ